MTAVRFVDTNVLLYAVSTEPQEQEKTARAQAILEETDLRLSVQVLQEFYVQSTHPARSRGLTHEQAVALIESWLRFPVQALTVPILQNALATKHRWRISYWDAAIVEAARESGCVVLLTEDLQDGMNFAGVRVINPFVDNVDHR